MEGIGVRPAKEVTVGVDEEEYDSQSKLYKEFTSIATIDKAWTFNSPNGRGSHTMFTISQPNLLANKKKKHMLSSVISEDSNGGLDVQWSPFPVEVTGASLMVPSPSGSKLLVVRNPENDSPTLFEIWGPSQIEKEIRVPQSVHGSVYADGWFEGISWSSDESLIAYVAEEPAQPKPTFNDTGYKKDASSTDKDCSSWKGQGDWEEDWGEAYVGKRQPALFVVNITSLIGTKLGRPIMLDAYTSNMCLDSWGRTSYARALIEVSADQIPLKSLVVAIPLIDVPGNSYHTIEVEYEWQPPHCEDCKVFGHSNDQCSKRVNEVNSSIDTNDGFIDAHRKGGKGKQTAKTNPISGVRLTKPTPKFIYRAKAKRVDNEASTSTDNSGKSDMKGKSDDVGNASKINDCKQGKGTISKSSKVVEVKTNTSNSFDVLASLAEEDVVGLSQEVKGSHDQRATNLKEKVQDTAPKSSASSDHHTSSKRVEASKPSTAPSSSTSAIKSSNPFSKVGEIVDSDSDEDEVFEPDNPMGSYFSSAGGGNELEDYFSEDYAAQVYDLPGQFHDFKIQCRARNGDVRAVDGIGRSLSVGQVVWAPTTKGLQQYLVFVGWPSDTRKFGMIYCFNRPCALYAVKAPLFESDVKDNAINDVSVIKLSEATNSAFLPRFTPDGQFLVFLSAKSCVDSGAHSATQSLHKIEWNSEGEPTPAKIIDVVPVVMCPEDGCFPGIYCFNVLSKPWLSDGYTMILSSIWGSSEVIISVNVLSGKVSRVTPGESNHSWSLLTLNDNNILAVCSSLVDVPQIKYGSTTKEESQDAIWRWLDVSSPTSESKEKVKSLLSSLQIDILKIPVKNVSENLTKGANKPIEAIFVSSRSKQDACDPMIVILHGGPHGITLTSFSKTSGFLASIGYSLLIVNYRGSIGFGEEALQSLPGKIGSQDVNDVLTAIDHAIETGLANPSKISVLGGSHGGFLTTHLIGQAPDRFAAAAARNPVCNLALMVGTSDIPDWCFVETFGTKGISTYTEAPSPKLLASFHEKSPISHLPKVKTPTLFLLGAKDLRVPVSNGLQFARALKEKGVPVKVIVFPEDIHPISRPQSDFESFVNIGVWFKKYCK